MLKVITSVFVLIFSIGVFLYVADLTFKIFKHNKSIGLKVAVLSMLTLQGANMIWGIINTVRTCLSL